MKKIKEAVRQLIRQELKSLNEGVNKRLKMMDELVDMVGSEEKLLEEVFRALSDRETKEIYDWIERHYS